jgi:hypothetical protein
MPTTPMGTRRKKIQRQLRISITKPPSGGPSNTPPWNDMVMYPLARPSAPSDMASMASTRVAEAIMAAPMPWARRKAMSQPTVGARPHSSELSVMTTNPPP